MIDFVYDMAGPERPEIDELKGRIEGQFWLDPHGHYDHIDPVQLASRLGVLPLFLERIRIDGTATSPAEAIRELEMIYRFPVSLSTQGAITKYGIRQFPGDKDAYPLFAMDLGNGLVGYIYESDFIGISDPKTGAHSAARFD